MVSYSRGTSGSRYNAPPTTAPKPYVAPAPSPRPSAPSGGGSSGSVPVGQSAVAVSVPRGGGAPVPITQLTQSGYLKTPASQHTPSAPSGGVSSTLRPIYTYTQESFNAAMPGPAQYAQLASELAAREQYVKNVQVPVKTLAPKPVSQEEALSANRQRLGVSTGLPYGSVTDEMVKEAGVWYQPTPVAQTTPQPEASRYLPYRFAQTGAGYRSAVFTRKNIEKKYDDLSQQVEALEEEASWLSETSLGQAKGVVDAFNLKATELGKTIDEFNVKSAAYGGAAEEFSMTSRNIAVKSAKEFEKQRVNLLAQGYTETVLPGSEEHIFEKTSTSVQTPEGNLVNALAVVPSEVGKIAGRLMIENQGFDEKMYQAKPFSTKELAKPRYVLSQQARPKYVLNEKPSVRVTPFQAERALSAFGEASARSPQMRLPGDPGGLIFGPIAENMLGTEPSHKSFVTAREITSDIDRSYDEMTKTRSLFFEKPPESDAFKSALFGAETTGERLLLIEPIKFGLGFAEMTSLATGFTKAQSEEEYWARQRSAYGVMATPIAQIVGLELTAGALGLAGKGLVSGVGGVGKKVIFPKAISSPVIAARVGSFVAKTSTPVVSLATSRPVVIGAIGYAGAKSTGMSDYEALGSGIGLAAVVGGTPQAVNYLRAKYYSAFPRASATKGTTPQELVLGAYTRERPVESGVLAEQIARAEFGDKTAIAQLKQQATLGSLYAHEAQAERTAFIFPKETKYSVTSGDYKGTPGMSINEYISGKAEHAYINRQTFSYRGGGVKAAKPLDVGISTTELSPLVAAEKARLAPTPEAMEALRAKYAAPSFGEWAAGKKEALQINFDRTMTDVFASSNRAYDINVAKQRARAIDLEGVIDGLESPSLIAARNKQATAVRWEKSPLRAFYKEHGYQPKQKSTPNVRRVGYDVSLYDVPQEAEAFGTLSPITRQRSIFEQTFFKSETRNFYAPIAISLSKQVSQPRPIQTPAINQTTRTMTTTLLKQPQWTIQRTALVTPLRVNLLTAQKTAQKQEQRLEQRLEQKQEQRLELKQEQRLEQRLEQKQEQRLSQRLGLRLAQRLIIPEKVRYPPALAFKSGFKTSFKKSLIPKKKKTQKAGVRLLLPDLFSASRSQFKFGSATSQRVTKSVWAQQGATGRLATKEERRHGFGGLVGALLGKQKGR